MPPESRFLHIPELAVGDIVRLADEVETKGVAGSIGVVTSVNVLELGCFMARVDVLTLGQYVVFRKWLTVVGHVDHPIAEVSNPHIKWNITREFTSSIGTNGVPTPEPCDV